MNSNPLPFSMRTTAATTVFAAYFTAQYARLFTTNGVTIGTLSQYAAFLFSQYQILITQPASVPIVQNFPLNSPDQTVLDAAITASATIISNINTTVQALTVDQAQAAAEARAASNAQAGI